MLFINQKTSILVDTRIGHKLKKTIKQIKCKNSKSI